MIVPGHGEKADFPYWLVILVVAGGLTLAAVLSDAGLTQVLSTLGQGVGTTLFVTAVAFALASVLGLVVALGGLSRRLVLRQAARLYVEVLRGLPIIVLLLYVAFVLAPAMVALWNWLAVPLGLPDLRTRDFPFVLRAIIALALAYAAFLAEIFRAGILSVDQGQVEAAKALGLSGHLRFRLVVFPQAIRTVFPSYANDLVAMVKDSSLVSVLGVADITQLGKVAAAGNFRYFETYNLVALIYLSLTIGLSILLRRFEQRMRLRHRNI